MRAIVRFIAEPRRRPAMVAVGVLAVAGVAAVAGVLHFAGVATDIEAAAFGGTDAEVQSAHRRAAPFHAAGDVCTLVVIVDLLAAAALAVAVYAIDLHARLTPVKRRGFAVVPRPAAGRGTAGGAGPTGKAA